MSAYGQRGEQCTACLKERSYRVHRNWWQRIRTLIDGRVPYVCRECGFKEYHWIDPRDRKKASLSTRRRTSEAS